MIKSIILIIFFNLLPVSAKNLEPIDIVKKTVSEVLETIQNDKEIIAGNKYKIIEIVKEKVTPYVDFERMTRLAVGRPWKEATDSQKSKLIDSFNKLLINSYAAAFSNYLGIVIEVGSQKIEGKRGTVSSKVKLPGGAPPLSIEYDFLYKNSWKLFDVKIDGSSMVINYRSMFSQTIATSGIDGLLEALEKKINETE
jgi:phospholipid transport system substrate-binding protein